VATAARRHPGRVLLATLPLQFAFGLVYCWGAVAPYVERSEHWPTLLLSAVFSATPIGYGTGIVIGGRLADRVPPRRLCWAGVGLLAIGGGVALTTPAAVVFVLLYSMLGLGLGGGLALAGSIAAVRHAMPERLGTASGLVTGAYAVAAPLQVPIVSALAANLGWLAALRLMGGSMLALAVLLLATMPAVPRPRHLGGDDHRHPSVAHLVGRPRLLTAFLLEVSGTPLGAYAFVDAAAYARDLRFAALLATAAITAVAVGNAAGRMLGGAASDRAGVDRVFLASLLIDVLAAALLAAHPGAAGIVAGALLAGAGFGVPAGVIGRLAEDAAPDAPNSAFGLIFAGFAVGAGGGSLLGAAVGGPSAYVVLALFPLAGLAVVAVRGRRRSA
jgi:MFS transporter, OFA family, oxalate/formate antiporter